MQGNRIGTDSSGKRPLGTSNAGVVVTDAIGNTLGGTEAEAQNTIACNASVGTRLESSASTGNEILRNSIFSNGDLGIDLGRDGVTSNDDKDPDAGPNKLQNYPALGSPVRSKKTIIQGTLNSTFTVRFYASPEADPSGHGEGQTYLGEIEVETDSEGNASSAFSTRTRGVKVLTATATDPEGNTSEFSKAAERGTGGKRWDKRQLPEGRSQRAGAVG